MTLTLWSDFFTDLGLEVQDADPFLTVVDRMPAGVPIMRLFAHTENEMVWYQKGIHTACKNFEMAGYYVYGTLDREKGMGLVHLALWGPVRSYVQGTYSNSDLLAFLCMGMGGDMARLPSAIANMEEEYDHQSHTEAY